MTDSRVTRAREGYRSKIISINQSQILDFSVASGDVNPLHVSDSYARTTPFGGIVAHGVLSFLLAATAVGQSLSHAASLSIRFNFPILPGMPVSVDVSENGQHVRVIAIRDGSRTLAESRIYLGAETPTADTLDTVPSLPLDQALDQVGEDIRKDLLVGPYWPDVAAIRRILAAVGTVVVPEWVIVQLCSLSFCAGMVFPGKRALLRSVDIERPSKNDWPLELSIETPTAASVGRGLARIVVNALDPNGLQPVTHLLWRSRATALIRREPVPFSPSDRSDLPLDGRTALIVGGSRGLGAALKESLIVRGCRTHVIQRSPTASSASHPLLSTYEVDASDSRAIEHVRKEVERCSGGLDYLFLNATGVLQPMRLDGAHVDRISAYLNHEILLSLLPLTTMLPLIRPGGICVYSSSQALTLHPNAMNFGIGLVDWPQYVAAKASVEAFIGIAKLEHPEVRFIVSRFPALDTTLTLRSSIAPGEPVGPLAEVLLEAWIQGHCSPYDIAGAGLT